MPKPPASRKQRHKSTATPKQSTNGHKKLTAADWNRITGQKIDEKGRKKLVLERVEKAPPGAKNASKRSISAWRRLCRRYVTRERTLHAVKKIMADPNHREHAAMFRFFADHGFGKAPQSVEHKGKVTLEEILAKSWEEDPKS